MFFRIINYLWTARFVSARLIGDDRRRDIVQIPTMMTRPRTWISTKIMNALLALWNSTLNTREHVRHKWTSQIVEIVSTHPGKPWSVKYVSLRCFRRYLYYFYELTELSRFQSRPCRVQFTVMPMRSMLQVQHMVWMTQIFKLLFYIVWVLTYLKLSNSSTNWTVVFRNNIKVLLNKFFIRYS